MLLTAAALSLALWLPPATALADFGSYYDQNGLYCFWSGSGSFYFIDCSGYSSRLGGYYSYTCDVDVIGRFMEWSCRDMRGNSWRGSR